MAQASEINRWYFGTHSLSAISNLIVNLVQFDELINSTYKNLTWLCGNTYKSLLIYWTLHDAAVFKTYIPNSAYESWHPFDRLSVEYFHYLLCDITHEDDKDVLNNSNRYRKMGSIIRQNLKRETTRGIQMTFYKIWPCPICCMDQNHGPYKRRFQTDLRLERIKRIQPNTEITTWYK